MLLVLIFLCGATMTSKDPTSAKDDARAALEELVRKNYGSKVMFSTTVFLLDKSTGDVTIHKRLSHTCCGHKTLDEALRCMETCMPLMRKELARERLETIKLAVAIFKQARVPFDPKTSLRVPFITITKTTNEVTEFASGG